MTKEEKHRLHLLLETWRRLPLRCPEVESGRNEECPEVESAKTKGLNPWHGGYSAGAHACAEELLDFLEEESS